MKRLSKLALLACVTLALSAPGFANTEMKAGNDTAPAAGAAPAPTPAPTAAPTPVAPTAGAADAHKEDTKAKHHTGKGKHKKAPKKDDKAGAENAKPEGNN